MEVVQECDQMNELVGALCKQADEPATLPKASEDVIYDIKVVLGTVVSEFEILCCSLKFRILKVV